MNEAEFIKQDRRFNALWWPVCLVAAGAVCASLVSAFSFDFPRIAILLVAVGVALLTAGFSIKVPKTESVFYPKVVYAFWGIAWLGLAGGILLALISSMVDRWASAQDRTGFIKGVARDVVCASVSALVFHSLIGYFGVETTVVAGSFSIPNEVILASCAMAVTYFAAAAAIDVLSFSMETGPVGSDALGKLVRAPASGHLLSLAVAIVLFLVFNHFGIEFGLVLLPLAIAANAAFRIHIRSLQQKTREITEASRIHLATVEALATAIDARDQVGVGHVRRTQIYAVGLGRTMGLSPMELEALQAGALLHDIGKLAVPDHILNKPGRLSQAEMEKTKIHSSVGASILEKVGFPSPVVPTVKYHHEFWDGSGYPEGLRGSQIPITARILSVADAFDTLRGARPYRPPVSRDDACSFMRAGAGTQFDPKVVELLLRNLRTFEDEIESEGLGYEKEGDHLPPARENSYVEQIKRANREVFTLYSLARDFSGSLTPEEVYSLFTDKITELVPYHACAIYLLDDTGDFATAVHVAGKMGGLFSGKRVKVGEGATGYALKKNKSVENVDPRLDLALSPKSGASEFKTMVSRPLVADDKVIGAISLYKCDPTPYQDEHIRILDTVSRIAGDAVAKSLEHAEAASHAFTDPITGLPNARALRVEFEKEVKRSMRNNSAFQVLMLDLDGFKAVNDTFGHKVGDRLLIELGGVIRSELREYDFLSRYAGDEFVALIPETPAESVQDLCRRIESAVKEFGIFISENEVARVGVSIGSSSYPMHGETFDQLIISADKAMYLNKSFRKQKRAQYDALINPRPTAVEFVPSADARRDISDETNRRPAVPEILLDELLVVELDESHVISTASVN